MDPSDQNQISNESNLNHPYTINNSSQITTQNSSNNKNFNQQYNNTNANNFSNYYNPIAIQNYYSMMNARNFQNNQIPVQMNNFYSTPYSLNKVDTKTNFQNEKINTTNANNNDKNQNSLQNPYLYMNNINSYNTNMTNFYNSNNQNGFKGTQMQNNFIHNLNFFNYQQQFLKMQNKFPNKGSFPMNYKYANNSNLNYTGQKYQQNFSVGNNNRNNYFNNYLNNNDKPPSNKNSNVTNEDPNELEKWVERRRRNFPSANNVKDKLELGKKKEDAGMISKLEMKLREKIKLMSSINKKGFMKKRNNRQRRKKRNKFKNKSLKPEEIEEGEIVELRKEDENEKAIKPILQKINENKDDPNKFNENKEKPKVRLGFRYRKNKIYEDMIKSDKLKELNIILQAFRYFVNENLI